MNKNEYVLITAARNEEAHIEKAIKSILYQTILPVKWVIVSDASTDSTDEIVKQYTKQCNFLQFLHLDREKDFPGFASKVHVINHGYEKLRTVEYGFIGNLDADVSIEADYYENILERFQQNPKLGLAGGFVYDEHEGLFKRRSGNNVEYVSGAIQLFRRECYEAIGGYVPVSVGGEDTIAAITARMKCWEVRAFPEIRVIHHKNGCDARGQLKESFRNGAMFFAIGSHPLVEIVKSFQWIRQSPFLIAAFLRLVGYFSQYCLRKRKPVNEEFIKFLRQDEFKRIKSLVKGHDLRHHSREGSL
jgi:glycosyltransferase involved in cell wall biosynthesis